MIDIPSILELVSRPWRLAAGGAYAADGILTPEQMRELVPIPIVNDDRVILVGRYDATWLAACGPWHIDHEIYRVSPVGRVSLRELYASRLAQCILTKG